MITEFAMDKKRASDRQILLFVQFQGSWNFTAESVTNPWHEFTLKLKKYFLKE